MSQKPVRHPNSSSIEDLRPGDCLFCIAAYRAHGITRGRHYMVLDVEQGAPKRVMIENDHKARVYYSSARFEIEPGLSPGRGP